MCVLIVIPCQSLQPGVSLCKLCMQYSQIVLFHCEEVKMQVACIWESHVVDIVERTFLTSLRTKRKLLTADISLHALLKW